MFLGIHDPDPQVRGMDPDPALDGNGFIIIPEKYEKYSLLSLKNYVNLSSQTKKPEKWCKKCRNIQDPDHDPDPVFTAMDPRIRIRIQP
jgi:hypothetical protein